MARPLKYKTDEERKQARAATRKKYGDYHKPGDRHKEGYQRPDRQDQYSHNDFVGWDGEGLNIQKPDGSIEHVYALLMNSVGDIKYSLTGLSTVDCLELLLKGAKTHPKAFHVAFASSYDINMILKDVEPTSILERLNAGQHVIWEAPGGKTYMMQYRPRRSFFVGRFVADKAERWKTITDKYGKTKRKPNYDDDGDAKITLWDSFGYYQGAFLKALRDNFSKDELKELDYDLISAGKKRRSEFKPEELLDIIIPYTRLEVRALVQLMNKLRDGVNEASRHIGKKIQLRRWDGSGSMSAAFMKVYGLKKVIEAARAITPHEVEQAGFHAFGGGRIEALIYGHYESAVFAYDINSAHPSSQVDMPDLSEGEWKHHVNTSQHVRTTDLFDIHPTPDLFKHAQPFSLFKISWRFPDRLPFYPFFNRGDDREIDYPQAGLNWVWYPELLAASKTLPNFWNDVYIHEMWEFFPSSDNKPFAFLRDLYDLRRKLKDEHNGGQLPLKLGYTGTYGKTAQKLGYDEKSGKIPPYFNILYAGYTTSATRAKVWLAAIPYKEIIVEFSTDGIKSLGSLDVPVSDKLGEWSFAQLTGLTLVRSGVYWTHMKSVDKDGNPIPCVDWDGNPDPCPLHGEFCAWGQYYRGFDREFLTEERVLDAWKKEETSMEVDAQRFRTMGSTLSPMNSEGKPIWTHETRVKRFKDWRTWDPSPRKLTLMALGTKRVEQAHAKNAQLKKPKIMTAPWGKNNPANGLVYTYARSNPFLDDMQDKFPYSDKVLSRKSDIPWDRGLEQEIADAEYQETDF